MVTPTLNRSLAWEHQDTTARRHHRADTTGDASIFAYWVMFLVLATILVLFVTRTASGVDGVAF